MLRLRVLAGVVLVPLLLLVATLGGEALGGLPYVALVTAAAGLGAQEVGSLLLRAGYRPLVPLSVALALLFPLDAQFAPGRLLLPGLAAAVILTLLLFLPRTRDAGALADWALTLAPPLYVGGLLASFIPLRFAPGGLFWAPAVLVTSWFCDSLAFFVGTAYGRVRLAPLVSPAKSVEGAAAGVAAATVVGAAAAAAVWLALPAWAAERGVDPLIGALLGLTVGVASVAGDLAESFLKRQTSAKESGALIPGHGGILDRMDSLLFAGAAAWLLLTLTGRIE